MDIKNKQAAVTSPISESDMRKGFKKYRIHLKLDQDTKTMHSVDALSNPERVTGKWSISSKIDRQYNQQSFATTISTLEDI
jgi:hypothetical protein